jgi:hypothetical protein
LEEKRRLAGVAATDEHDAVPPGGLLPVQHWGVSHACIERKWSMLHAANARTEVNGSKEDGEDCCNKSPLHLWNFAFISMVGLFEAPR